MLYARIAHYSWSSLKFFLLAGLRCKTLGVDLKLFSNRKWRGKVFSGQFWQRHKRNKPLIAQTSFWDLSGSVQPGCRTKKNMSGFRELKAWVTLPTAMLTSDHQRCWCTTVVLSHGFMAFWKYYTCRDDVRVWVSAFLSDISHVHVMKMKNWFSSKAFMIHGRSWTDSLGFIWCKTQNYIAGLYCDTVLLFSSGVLLMTLMLFSLHLCLVYKSPHIMCLKHWH